MVTSLITIPSKKKIKNSLYLSHSVLDLNYKPYGKSKILEHPWNNYKKFLSDSKKIDHLYKSSIKILSKHLNIEFNCNYDERCWEIFFRSRGYIVL